MKPDVLARRLGALVGAGRTPDDAAAEEYLSLSELIRVRVEHWVVGDYEILRTTFRNESC